MNKSKKDFLIGIFVFILDIVLFYHLWKNNIVLSIVFFVVSFFVLLMWTNKEEKFLYLVGFLLGPIYDIILIPTGIWSYGNATIFGIPLWLPLAYGISTVAIVKIGRSVAELAK